MLVPPRGHPTYTYTAPSTNTAFRTGTQATLLRSSKDLLSVVGLMYLNVIGSETALDLVSTLFEWLGKLTFDNSNEVQLIPKVHLPFHNLL